MRLVLVVLVALLVVPVHAQAPIAALLKDAQAEQTAAAKALNESDVYQRFLRAKRLVDGLQALVDAEKAKAEQKETGSK